MKNGGTVFPVAFTAHAIVTRVPRLLDVTHSTCFYPLQLMIRLGFWTVVTPASSTLSRIHQLDRIISNCVLLRRGQDYSRYLLKLSLASITTGRYLIACLGISFCPVNSALARFRVREREILPRQAVKQGTVTMHRFISWIEAISLLHIQAITVIRLLFDGLVSQHRKCFDQGAWFVFASFFELIKLLEVPQSVVEATIHSQTTC